MLYWELSVYVILGVVSIYYIGSCPYMLYWELSVYVILGVIRAEAYDLPKHSLQMVFIYHMFHLVVAPTRCYISICLCISGSKVQVPSEIVILNTIVLPHKDISRSEINQIIL